MNENPADSVERDRVPRVLMFSNTSFLRQALAQILVGGNAVFIIGVAADLGEVRTICQQRGPDLILFDTGLPDGYAGVRELRVSVPSARVIALGLPRTDTSVIAWAEAGLTNHISTSGGLVDIIASVLSIIGRGRTCTAHVAAGEVPSLADRKQTDRGEGYNANLPSLTVRESEILKLICDGLSNKEIAQKLGIGESTAKCHVHNLLLKLNLTRRGQAAAWARDHVECEAFYKLRCEPALPSADDRRALRLI
jgi:two-component system, NarL family, nitrate/nitrite response regulator NarL